MAARAQVTGLTSPVRSSTTVGGMASPRGPFGGDLGVEPYTPQGLREIRDGGSEDGDGDGDGGHGSDSGGDGGYGDGDGRGDGGDGDTSFGVPLPLLPTQAPTPTHQSGGGNVGTSVESTFSHSSPVGKNEYSPDQR